MGRPRAPLLSRERIVEAALALVDAEGLSALSTRRLAAGLGVSGPSLYNHFATKDALLDAVADRIIAQVDISALAELPWPEALRAWAFSYHATLAEHPNLVPVVARGPGRRTHALRMADAVYGALVEADWPPREATRIGALMRFFVTGSALGSFAAGFVDDPEVYQDGYPHLTDAHRLHAHRLEVDRGAFETGLDALVAGLMLRFPNVRRTGSQNAFPDTPAAP
jgi:AcrR family transcriptional regulator